MKPRILIVDDEQDLCEILQFNLEAAGYEVLTATSAEEALERLEGVDLMLLDVMMPGMSGFQLAERIGGRVPIIFLTARDAEDDLLRGFRLGADDYVAKPFSVRELLARVKAVLSRVRESAAPSISYKGLAMDLEAKTVSVDGREVAFTKTEFELLWLLMSHEGRVYSREELIDRVWPQDVIVTGRTVDVNITRIRKKIGRYAACLATRQRFGYCFEAPLSAPEGATIDQRTETIEAPSGAVGGADL
ncbi:MAG: response regulator transcription factor [Prevotella sp.]|nr:response regulator transcription factor [Prevotella sp.]